MSEFDETDLREKDIAHRILTEVSGSQSSIAPAYGDSVNLPDTFYVDSGNGSDNNDGRDPAFPMATIDAAINKCTASQGDIILVFPGHSESPTAAIELDVIGVSVIGIGNGTLRPQITMAADDNCFEISAVNCKIENIYFNERTVTPTSNNALVDVAAANAKILRCHFDVGAEDLDSITLQAAADSCEIGYCKWVTTANGPDSAIRVEDVSVDLLWIHHNFIDGGNVTNAFDEGHIVSAVVHTNCLVEYNTLHAIVNTFGLKFSAAATGIIQYNSFGLGTLGGMLDPGSCMCVQNFEQDAINESAMLVPDINPAGSVGGGAHGGIDDATTDSLHGKLGTDTEMSDRSLFDEIEGAGAVGAPTPTVHGANVNIVDMLAWLHEGVRRGTGTVNPADISLYDLIGGTKGHPAWPTAAAYTNDVSLMEVVGYIQDSVTTTSGSRIPGLGTQLVRAAASDLHAASATVSAFTVGTGRILLMGLIVEVSVAGVAAVNCDFKFQSNPSTGTAADLCANLDIISKEVGTLLSLDGVVGTALLSSATASSVLLLPNAAHGIVIPPGTIDAVASADANDGGSLLEITVYYIPLDTGATLVTA
ncbi:hypothetical protein LCGC14_1034890 [marine sediment metagenome]|uniref:Uncharacterized protein n=1 Tax=marine sediment metagenome TaxID=412755 RepID=A0A0F9QBM8_9ZZZZ